jgi:6-hydroxytryprostatin B O-methyltransferase
VLYLYVKVGGSLGHASIAIVEKFPDIQITVQDLPDVVKQGRTSLPNAPHTQRVSFESHDCFHEQKTIADAYLLRQILHDWPDEDAERIVRNIVPAMRPGARLLIMDIVVPQPGVISPYMEKYIRVYDISMFSMFSAKERTLEQFRELVERCDARLRFEGVICPPGSVASLLSWVFTEG